MSKSKTWTAAVVASLLASAAEAVADNTNHDFTIRSPGHVLVDPESRQRELSSMPAKFTRRICPVRPICAYNPVPVIDGDERASGQTLVQQGLDLNFAVARYLRDCDPLALRNIRTVFMDWSRADAAHRHEGRTTRARHYMKLGFLPMINAYAVAKHARAFSASEIVEVEDWMQKMVDAIDQNNLDGKRLSDKYNSRYSRDLVNMAWGALTGDEIAFQKGLERFDAALDDMNPDGSLPGEMLRKSYALSYQNLALSILVSMAEVAAHQEIDLYSRERDGRSLHLAIGFLVTAAEDLDLVRAYQDMPQAMSRLRSHLAWTEAYLVRFPEHPNAEPLRRLRERRYFTSGGTDGFSGGIFSCLYAKPETNPLMLTRPPAPKDEVPGVSKRFAKVTCPRYLD